MNLKFAILTITLAVLNRNGTAEKEDNFDEEMIGGCCKQIMKNKTDTTTTFNFNSEMARCVFEKTYEPIFGLVPKIGISKFDGNNKMQQWNSFHSTSMFSPMVISGGFRPTGFPPTPPIIYPQDHIDSVIERAMAPMNHPDFPFNQGGMGFPGQPQYNMRTMKPRPIPMHPQPIPMHPQPIPMHPQPIPMNPQPFPMNPQTQPQQHQAPRRSRRSSPNRQWQQGGSSVISNGGSSVISSGGSSMISNGRMSVISNGGSSMISRNGNEITLEGRKGKICLGIQKLCLEINFNSELDYSKCKEPESDAGCPAFVDELRQVRANSAKSSEGDKNQ